MPKIIPRHSNAVTRLVLAGFVVLGLVGIWGPFVPQTSAQTVVNPQSLTVTALVLPPPPTDPAILDPSLNNAITPTAVFVLMGTCQPNSTVRAFNNGTLIGTVTCSPDGEFVMNVTLEPGENIITVLNYDEFDQPGPASAPITITVNLPEPSPETQTAGAISPSGVINLRPASGQTNTFKEQKIFEETLLEPLAKPFNQNIIVPTGFNAVSSIILDVILVTMTMFMFGLAVMYIGVWRRHKSL